jgi:hypothetical protein
MLRASTWAVGLFGLAMVVCRAFPWPWLEPIALLALGVAMLWASARSGPRTRRARATQPKEAAA